MPDTTSHPIRVLLIDPDPRVRAALRELLNGEPDVYVCGEARNGLDARDKIAAVGPDVVLLDLMLPSSIDGFAILGLLGTMRVPSVVLTTANALRDEATRAGASAFLEKDGNLDRITQAIRSATFTKAAEV